MMVVTVDLDQEPTFLESRLWFFILFPLVILSISCIMDVDVISGYIGCQTLLVMGLVNYQQLAR